MNRDSNDRPRIPPSTARLAMILAVLGSVWAVFREYLRYQETGEIRFLSLVLAVVVPLALYWVIRANSD